jgi:hypothetical protein
MRKGNQLKGEFICQQNQGYLSINIDPIIIKGHKETNHEQGKRIKEIDNTKRELNNKIYNGKSKINNVVEANKVYHIESRTRYFSKPTVARNSKKRKKDL